MTMPFVRNLWYMAAFAEEVGRELMSRTICNAPILLYRKEDGQAVAMGNRCPHRFAPLNMGKLKGDSVECPYHGLIFNADGKGVHNPHGHGHIPAGCGVPAYPLVERHGLIWLWFGDPDCLDYSSIPDFSCLTDDVHFRTVKGLITMAAHYELITDNLVDLSHVEYLHKGILGSEAIKRGKHKVKQTGMTVQSDRWCADGLAPPAWDLMFGNYGKPVDHWLNMRWDPPAHMLLDVGVTPVGKSRDEGIWVYGTDIITPETETTSHYFWGVSRAYELHNPAADDMWIGAIEGAFTGQDKPMLEAVQRMMGSNTFETMRPIFLEPDTGALRCRRIISDLLKKEAARLLPPAAEAPITAE
jgi:phenylpropionate dioxygenase-like ring-hydroxylating dioxygenase large terminal subunit